MNQTVTPDVSAGRLNVPAISRENRNGPIRYRSPKAAARSPRPDSLLMGRQLQADAECEHEECQRGRVEFLDGGDKTGQYEKSRQQQLSSVQGREIGEQRSTNQRNGEDHGGYPNALAVE